MNYQLHPLCTLFPRIDGKEFTALCDDIKSNGLRNPIVLHDGMILDGGNRYRACIEAGVEPEFTQFEGGNLVAFVLSANLHRRHLTAGQNAAIVASAQDWGKAQKAGNPLFGNITGLDTVANRSAQSGASDKTQRQADKVAKANPELAKQVAHGEVSLQKAVAQIEKKPATPKPPKLEIVPDELAALRTENEDLREAYAEQGKTIKELIDDNNSMAVAFEADDKLAALDKENKKLREMNRILEERVRGLQNECLAAKRAAQAWQRKAEKLA